MVVAIWFDCKDKSVIGNIVPSNIIIRCRTRVVRDTIHPSSFVTVSYQVISGNLGIVHYPRKHHDVVLSADDLGRVTGMCFRFG